MIEAFQKLEIKENLLTKKKKKLPTTDDLRFFVVFFQDLQFAFIFIRQMLNSR